MKVKFFNGLKNTLCLMVCAGLLFGCQPGQDGEPGPQGPAGAAGAKGPQGLPGDNATIGIKLGSFTGTATGQLSNGTPFSEAINYQYVPQGSVTSFTQVDGVNKIRIYQRDSLRSGRIFLEFETDANFANPRFVLGNFESTKAEANNQYTLVEANYSFSTRNTTYTRGEVTGTLSNISYSAATGTLTGSLDWQVDNADFNDTGFINGEHYYVSFLNTSASGQPMRIKGTFSVPLRQRSYRVQAGQ